jgi:hypothetical protein
MAAIPAGGVTGDFAELAVWPALHYKTPEQADAAEGAPEASGEPGARLQLVRAAPIPHIPALQVPKPAQTVQVLSTRTPHSGMAFTLSSEHPRSSSLLILT